MGCPANAGTMAAWSGTLPTTAACAWYGAHRNRQPVSWQKLMELARDGDAIALETIQRTGGFLISGLVNLINIVDAECIYLGDKGAEMLELIQPHMEQELNERAPAKETCKHPSGQLFFRCAASGRGRPGDRTLWRINRRGTKMEE